MGTNSPNLGLNIPTPADPAVANVWPSLWNTNAQMIDSSIAGLLTKDVSGSSNVALTFTNGSPNETDNAIFILTGALTGNVDVLFPNGKTKLFMVKNSTTGAFALSLGVNNSGVPAGSVAVIPAGSTGLFYSDGTNVFSAFPTTFVSPTFTGTMTMPDGSTWTSVGLANLVKLGIGMSPANILDILQNQNAESVFNLLNTVNGAAAASRLNLCAPDLNHTLTLARYPSGRTGTLFGFSLANCSVIFDNSTSSGGFLFGTSTASPIIAGVNGVEVWRTGSDGSLLVGNTTNAGPGQIADAIGNVRDIPVNTQNGGYTLVATDNGKCVAVTSGGNLTLPNSVFQQNKNNVLLNVSGGPITIVQGSGVTMTWIGTGSIGSRTLATAGMATVLWLSASTCVITGTGLS